MDIDESVIDHEGLVSSDDEEFKEGTPQKYITPIEVRDHLKKMWEKERALLDLMYGRIDTEKETYADSDGIK